MSHDSLLHMEPPPDWLFQILYVILKIVLKVSIIEVFL